jgi:hypothetical protein
MGRNVQNLVFMLLGIVLASQFSLAQRGDWENVKQLPQGQDVKVRLLNGKSYRGPIQSVTDDRIILGSGQSVQKPDVQKVLSKGRSHRGRHALIGAGIGAAAGLGFGAAVDNDCTKTSFFCTGNSGKAIATPLFAVVGLAIGAALPSSRWHEVYRGK